jgi:UDP-N-acetylenolpyruvoylglucosamine reductase
LERIPAAFIREDKIPAGRLLQAVGANGSRHGGAQVADYHGNLFINAGGATARDLLALADACARRVFEQFGIRLEPEARILDDAPWPHLRAFETVSEEGSQP